MGKIKIFTNILLLLTLTIILFGCNGVEVTQTSKTIEAGTKSIDPIKLISVKNSDQYNIEIISNNIDASKLGKYVVEYNIINKQTNKEFKSKFNFDVVDTTPPEIILNKGKEVTVPLGDTFNPLNYIELKDNYDQSIAKESVIIENAVNTNTKGTYYVNYSISDSAGNKATASLQVKVTNPTYKIGQKFTLNKYDITFNSYRFNRTDSEPQTGFYEYYNANEGETFLICNVTIKNNDDIKRQPFEIFGDDSYKLQATVKYDDQYIYDDVAHGLNNNWYDTFRTINPLSSQTCNLTFQVPIEVSNSGKSLVVHLQPYSNDNDVVYIKIR